MADQQVILGKTLNGALLKGMALNKSLSGEAKPVTVNFENGRKALLDQQHPRAAGWAKMIAYLQENNRPVYVETAADSDVITGVYVPEAARVWEIGATDKEVVTVSFYTSTAWHHLRRDHPGFQAMLKLLQEALDKNSEVLVTATDRDFEIIDVRALPSSFGNEKSGLAHNAPVTGVSNKTVSLERAKELFEMMVTQSCTLNPFGNSCIPFFYPYDGCWIRAHLMCYLMMDEGETPEKIWSTGKLQTRSSNVPECRVGWSWHVAATLMVEEKNGEIIKMVFDPSMCNEPVPAEKWLLLQTDPKIKYTCSDWEKYNHFGTEADQEKANNDMEPYRIKLEEQWGRVGLPPYNCPV